MWDVLQLDDFLSGNPRFRIAEINTEKVVLSGEYHLKAQLAGSRIIDKTYRLKLVCPNGYPRKLPRVLDEERYFPRRLEFHTYSDGSFCLGSELKIKHILRADHTIKAFFDKAVDPFLYSVSHRLEYGDYPFGELAHGEQGLVDDYAEMFGLEGKAAVLLAFKVLGKRKREANKLPCPCGCGLRFGRCDYRLILNGFRNIEQRHWFRAYLENTFTPFEQPKKVKKTDNPHTPPHPDSACSLPGRIQHTAHRHSMYNQFPIPWNSSTL